MTKAAIYARVSTEAQAEKQTIKTQLDACRTYCAQKGYEVAAEFKDEGVSGALPLQERPAGRALLAALKKGEAEVVVIYCVDRLSRDNETGVPAYNLLRRQTGERVDFVLQSFDDTPEGELQFHLFLSIADYERKVIARRLRLGRERAARDKGRFNCNRTPFGYDTKKKRLVANEAEAEIVRYVYDLYVKEGLSYVALARRLDAEGVPTKMAEANANSFDGEKKGWLNTTVEHLIKNPLYKGEAYFNKSTKNVHGVKNERTGRVPKYISRPQEEWIPIGCPAIVSEDTWSAAQRRARKNLKRSQRPKDGVTKFLLGGLLKCHCGRKMYGASSGKGKKGQEPRRYLYCAGQKHYGTPCHPGYHDAEAVERAVLDNALELFRNPQRVLQHCDDWAEQQRAVEGWTESQMERLRRELAAAEAKKQRSIGLYTDGTISKAQLNADLRRIDDENKGHKDELARMEAAASQRKTAKEAEQAAWAIAARIKDVVGELTIGEEKELLRTVVEMVTISREGQPTVEYVLRTDTVMAPAGV